MTKASKKKTQKELREKIKESMQNENTPIGSYGWLTRQEGVEDELVKLFSELVQAKEKEVINVEALKQTKEMWQRMARKELVGKIEKMRKKPVAKWDGGEVYDTEQDEGYNQAIEDILSSLKEGNK